MNISIHPVEHEDIMAYLDGELPPQRAAETASHLAECAHCRRVANDLQEVSQKLLEWQVEESVFEPAESVKEALAKRPSGKAASAVGGSWRGLVNPRDWPKLVLVFAGMGLIVLMVLAPSLLRSRRYASEEYSYGPPSRYAPAPQPKMPAPTSPKPETTGSQTLAPAPMATPQPGQGTAGKLEKDEQQDEGEPGPTGVSVNKGPMIVRTAELELTTKDFDGARSSVEEILKRHQGYVGELNVNTPTGSARSLTGTLRVPAGQLDATLNDLKGLGRMEKESQEGEEVTQQYVDLQARLANAKHTEQRLVEMQRDRTGKLSDVLAVEMQISRVRGEIEQMEAQRKTMKNQVDFATVSVTLTEEYKAEINAVPPSTSTQFRNAAVEGYRSLVDGIISVLLWLLSVGPTLLLWAAILFFPARFLWRKIKPKFASEIGGL